MTKTFIMCSSCLQICIYGENVCLSISVVTKKNRIKGTSVCAPLRLRCISRSINRGWAYQSFEQSSSRIGSIYKQCARTFRSLVCEYLEFNLSKWKCGGDWVEQVVSYRGMRVVHICLHSCERVFELDLRTDLRIFKIFFNLPRIYRKLSLILRSRYYEITRTKSCEIVPCE